MKNISSLVLTFCVGAFAMAKTEKKYVEEISVQNIKEFEFAKTRWKLDLESVIIDGHVEESAYVLSAEENSKWLRVASDQSLWRFFSKADLTFPLHAHKNVKVPSHEQRLQIYLAQLNHSMEQVNKAKLLATLTQKKTRGNLSHEETWWLDNYLK